MDTVDKKIKMSIAERENENGEVKFAFQFPVNSNSIYNISLAGNPNFKKSEYTIIKPMRVPLISKTPSEHYKKIVDDFTLPVLEAFKKLKTVIEEYEKTEEPDSTLRKIEIFVPAAIDKCIKDIKVINKVKMERMMIIIKTGINSHCDFEVTEALTNLEHLIGLYFPEDRRNICEIDSNRFKKSIIDMSIVNPESIVKLLEKIDISVSHTNKVREHLLKFIVNDRSKITRLLIDYVTNINKTETIINSTVSVNETFNILNEKNNTISEGKCKKFEFSSLTVSIIVVDAEMYVDYYGFVDRAVGGSFSIDFYRFRNFINDNITHYIFYLVTCHYCMMNPDNILKVKFDIEASDVQSMFLFFEDAHMVKIMESIEDIPQGMCHMKMFSVLYRFFYELMGKTRPEQLKPKTVKPEHAKSELNKTLEITSGGKKVSISIPPPSSSHSSSSFSHDASSVVEKNERLTIIKKRNNLRKLNKK